MDQASAHIVVAFMLLGGLAAGPAGAVTAATDTRASTTQTPQKTGVPQDLAPGASVDSGRKAADAQKDDFYRRYFRKGREASGEDLPTNPEEKEALLKKILPKHTPTPPGDPQVREIRELIHELGTDHHRRMSAIERLAMIGEPAVPALRRTLRDSYKFKRIGALDALGYIHALEAVPDIWRCLDDPEPAVRVAALKTLGRMRHGPSLDRIAAKLKDPELRVRREAVLALPRMKGTTGRGVLLRALDNSRPEIRRIVCEELARFEGERVVSALLAASRDQDRDTRLSAVRALGEIGDPRARGRLQALSRGDDAMLRREALQALKNLNEEGSE